MNKLRIDYIASPPHSSIVIGKRGLAMSSRYLRDTFGETGRYAVVTDDTVFDLYGAKLLKSLGMDSPADVFILPSGEASKRFESVISICNFLSERGFTRSDVLIGMGGGAVCDITGFAASVFMRGMGLALIPTTLLAMCDASIGGKTAVDTVFGKNLMGSFYPARLIIEDFSTLSTLSDEQFSDGCAEVIKTAFISFNAGYGQTLIRMCEDIRLNIEEILTTCGYIKAAFVRDDLYDSGKRAILNFGHTIGHAVEFLSDYTVTHGCAVAIGMAAAARASVRMRCCKADTRDFLLTYLNKYSLPSECPFTAEEVFEAAKNDKKRRGEQTMIIVMRDRDLQSRIVDDDGLLAFIRNGLK